MNNATGEALVERYDLSDPVSTELKPDSNVYFAPLRPGPNSVSSLKGGFAAVALPAQVLSSSSDIDAVRFLTQATFGPTDATIAEVKRHGFSDENLPVVFSRAGRGRPASKGVLSD